MKLLAAMLAITSLASSAATDKTKCLFAQPLILGASVSAGYGTSDGGPATVISRMINPEARLDNQARSGATSVESTRTLRISSVSASLVFALDLFFWDAARDLYSREFEEKTRKLFSGFQKIKIPMIVGKVPIGAKFPDSIKEAGQKRSAGKINNLLEELCTLDKNCLLYDPVECFNLMKAPVSPEGISYFSDRLHTTNEGNKFCANIFVASGLYKKLECLK